MVWSTLVDINGDGLPDRVMRLANSPYTNCWLVQINTVRDSAATNSFNGLYSQGVTGSDWNAISASSGGDTYVDFLDINGDGLPDRVMRSHDSPYDHFCCPAESGTILTDERHQQR